MADNLASLDMPFLSIIAYYNKPNKSQNHTSTLFITYLLQKQNFVFNLRKTGPAKTGAARPIPLALIRVPYRANPDPMASKAHARDKMLQGGAGENLTGGSRNYGQGCNSGDNTVQKQFCVPNLSCGKEGRGTEASNNLKSLNTFVSTEHFKMEGLHILPDLIQAQDWMIKMDLKDAYLQVPIHREDQHFLQFQWNRKIFQFPVPSIWANLSTTVFLKGDEACSGNQGRQSKCKSGKTQRYSYDGYKTTLAAAKGSLI